ncbi:uncharacterized protein LOC117322359 [Pecten maximus]|uniref:uncharacterized protein LOC117322359 n=1 Tax=Pecten maximus TaxID=6579 RepID=UPI0014585AED|nr:uncharacterized protein LOC117322359 [Pecten maximus]XP_033733114.1 uncharacterized protein LOC117322359 [Pecten maximus]XP_033733115.1 uncharacterized protein LOC117322359 [Pecten maximus]
MAQYVINQMDTFHGDVSFIGIPYEAFERTGHWSLWGVVRMFEAARLIGLYNGLFYYKSMEGKGIGLVVITQAVRLSPDLHRDYSLFKTLKQRYVLDIVEVGRRSFSFVTRLTNEETGQFLGEILLKYVLIDRSTRKSIPLPEAFLEKYSKHTKKEIKFRKLSIPSCPDMGKNVFKLKVLPLHSDTDRNNHVNQSGYFRFCIDCATDAALAGNYRHFTSDMCWYPVLEMNVYHANESLVNEELVVNTWQDNEDFRLIFFIIKRKDTVLFKASFLFYPEMSKRKRNSRM